MCPTGATLSYERWVNAVMTGDLQASGVRGVKSYKFPLQGVISSKKRKSPDPEDGGTTMTDMHLNPSSRDLNLPEHREGTWSLAQ